MNSGEAVRTALREITAHKFRSVLSFSALAVGAASILYTFAQTHGMKEAMIKALELQGRGSMTISQRRNYVSRGLSPGLTLEDAEEIRRAMPSLYMVMPFVEKWDFLNHRGKKVSDVNVTGITPDWTKRNWVYKLRGRFLNDWDVKSAARVCVIVEPPGWFQKPWWGGWVRESEYQKFAKRQSLLGETIRIQSHEYLVVGSLAPPPRDKDPRWFNWETNSVLLPVTTFLRFIQRDGVTSQASIASITVDSGDEKTVPAAKRRLETLLKARHRGEEDFEINDAREGIQNQLNEQAKWIRAGMVLGAIAMFAGGIGIMNVTLAALFSRVKEIGIRRAIGASRADVLVQFVVEAAFLGLAGGVAGVELGRIGIAYLARNSQRELASVTWYHLLGVVAISIAASTLSSLYPACKAAWLDPVDALKNE